MTRSHSKGAPDASTQSAYWAQSVEDLCARLAATRNGLSTSEAARRRKLLGSNVLMRREMGQAATIFLAQFRSPLVLILVLAASIAFLVGELQEAVVIWLIVLATSMLSFVQEYRASRSMEALRSRIAPTTLALRDGKRSRIAVEDVVPGDVVQLSAGDIVPADGVVMQATDLELSEAALTGEAFPATKEPGVAAPEMPLSKRSNTVFAGTTVQSGMGQILIVRTGADTEFAAIAAAVEVEEPETEFARGIRRFGYLMMEIMLCMTLLVFAANVFLHRPMVDSLLFSVALAVGLTPELLPAIVIVTLARGAHVMLRNGVIVRRLASIENLGSMDILCTDKTGTLTEGVIRLDRAADPKGTESSDVMLLAALNATLQSGLVNPLDDAIAAANRGREAILGDFRKIDEIPYDFTRKRLTVIVRNAREDADLLICKGALINVLDVCTSIAQGDGESPLSQEGRDAIEALYKNWSEEGYRVLGLAAKRVRPRDDYESADETNLSFRGFLLFQDAAKTGIQSALASLVASGIGLKMVTGDNRYAAAHLARQIGLPPDRIMTGQAIGELSSDELLTRVGQIDIFAEIDPVQKERIVWALRSVGHVVGYLGDGINDVPALEAADVSVTVDGAVDVAREAADIVLLRKDISVLRRGVEDGRRTFANTMKYISITTSANFGNMISMALASLALPFLPLLAKQILLNNFLSDIPSLAIATDAVDTASAAEPRRWNISDIRRFMIVFGLTSSFFDLVSFAYLLGFAHATEREFQTGWFVVSLLTELGIVFVARTSRAAWKSRPSRLLLWSTIAVACLTIVMPWLPLAESFGFVSLSPAVLAWLIAITGAYLLASEAVKHWLYPLSGHWLRRSPTKFHAA